MTPTESIDTARRFMRYALEDGVTVKALRFALDAEIRAHKAGSVAVHSYGGYVTGCRCGVCTAGAAEYRRLWRGRQTAVYDRTEAA